MATKKPSRRTVRNAIAVAHSKRRGAGAGVHRERRLDERRAELDEEEALSDDALWPRLDELEEWLP